MKGGRVDKKVANTRVRGNRAHVEVLAQEQKKTYKFKNFLKFKGVPELRSKI